jgi:hypothetical protein
VTASATASTLATTTAQPNDFGHRIDLGNDDDRAHVTGYGLGTGDRSDTEPLSLLAGVSYCATLHIHYATRRTPHRNKTQLKDVRNRFAHSMLMLDRNQRLVEVSFDTQQIADYCNELKSVQATGNLPVGQPGQGALTVR